MATKFLEPGGDATFAVATTNGFWGFLNGSPSLSTDNVHGSHIKSLGFTNGGGYLNYASTPSSVLSDTGSRISFYFLTKAYTTSAATTICMISKVGTTSVAQLKITSAGVLQLFATTSQIGSDGPTLAINTWYRISIAYTVTSTSVNRFEVFVDGVSAISVTNATLINTVSTLAVFGCVGGGDANTALRFSDLYIDDSSSLADTGNIWVTAKRPNANGTTNGFTTQIGAGGSGYGSGHSPQVNERALSTTNGWSMVGAGAAVTEEYNIESKSAGDIDISTATIIDWVGWVSVSSLVGETINMILNGANISQAITSTITLYKKVKGSATYPAGAGADIGIQTDTTLTTVSLYECGVIVAYIPSSGGSGPANLKSYNTNPKANIKSINGNPIANIKSINSNV